MGQGAEGWIQANGITVAKTTAPPELVPTPEAVRLTGLSRSTLCRWVAQGLFEEGTHYRNGLTARSPRRWNVLAVERRIEQLRKLPDPLRPDFTGDQALAAAADN